MKAAEFSITWPFSFWGGCAWGALFGQVIQAINRLLIPAWQPMAAGIDGHFNAVLAHRLRDVNRGGPVAQ